MIDTWIKEAAAEIHRRNSEGVLASDEIAEIIDFHYNRQDICGLCGQPGADKMALWTGGGLYWPGERKPETELVHAECESNETERAHSCLTQQQIDAVLRNI